MGLSTTHLLIFLVIIVLIFGTKKLKNIGSDLGGAAPNLQQRRLRRCKRFRLQLPLQKKPSTSKPSRRTERICGLLTHIWRCFIV